MAGKVRGPAEIRRDKAIAELWRRGDLSYLLHDTQLKIDRSVRSNPARQVLVLSSRQLGKSFWAVCYAVSFAICNPGTLTRVYAPVLDKLKDIVGDNLLRIVSEAPRGALRQVKSENRWKLFNGSELRLGTLADAHVDGNRGGNAKLVLIEEGGFVGSDSYKYVLRSVIGPQIFKSKGKVVNVTSPSKDLEHYIHTHLKPKCELSGSLYSYSVYENPLLDRESIDYAQDLCGIPDHVCTYSPQCLVCYKSVDWRREYLAEIVRDEESVVVPEFSKANNVKEMELPPHLKWTLIVDSGFAEDLTAAALTFYDFERAKFCVWDALIWPRYTHMKTISDDLKALEQKWKCGKNISRFLDGEARLRTDMSMDYGHHFSTLRKDEVHAQINRLRVAFSKNVAEIHPRCEHVIATLENGRWNKKRTDFEKTATLGHLDSLMAVVYAVRHQDRTNPYPENFGLSENTHAITESSGERKSNLAKALLKPI